MNTSKLISVICLQLVALFISSTLVNALSPEQIQILEENISRRLLNEGHVPSLTLSIVQDGELVLSKGYGFRNIEKEIPATNDTLYNVGSLSKMMSSLFITRLLNQKFPQHGENVLDIPVNDLAPNFNLTFNDRYRTEYATFRDLLSHKMCIDTMLDTVGATGTLNQDDVVYLQRYLGQVCHFRNIQISYNNGLIQVAAKVAEAINGDGTPFEDLMESFFEEIGMDDSRVIRKDDNLEELPNMSQPYYYRDNQLKPFNIDLLTRSASIPSSAGILTTANDMAKYMKLLINKGKNDEGIEIIKEEIIDWITRISTPYRYNSFKQSAETDRTQGEMGYGIGLILANHDSWQVLRHSGWNPPYSSLMNVYPALKLGIFTSASGPSWQADHWYVHFTIVDMVRGFIKTIEDTKNLNYKRQTGPEYIFPADTQIFPPSSSFEELPKITPIAENTKRLNHSLIVGSYGLPVAGSFNITNVNETTLYLSFGKWGTGYLMSRPETPAIYDVIYDTDLVHHFYAQGTEPPGLAIDFILPLIANVHFGGGRYPFLKGYQMNLPEIPYDPSSCGPKK